MHFFAELPKVFDWLFEIIQKPTVPAYPLGTDEDAAWRPPETVTAWGLQVPLEVIRFAAANRLCVDLAYDGSRRSIQPYSLRRTTAGNIILHAIRNDNGEHRSYRIDKIEGAEATNTPFVPRYAVELTESGHLSNPPAATRSLGIVARPSTLSRRRSPIVRTLLGPKYVIQCSACGKHFTRLSQDMRLNPHKNRSGFDCYGRVGFLVKTSQRYLKFWGLPGFVWVNS